MPQEIFNQMHREFCNEIGFERASDISVKTIKPLIFGCNAILLTSVLLPEKRKAFALRFSLIKRYADVYRILFCVV